MQEPAARRLTMKLCSNCEYLNPEGFLFCEDCGENLLHAVSVPTPPSADDQLRLQLTADGRVFTLSTERTWTLGRADADATAQPDIDLGGAVAQAQGVSVRHAVIYFSTRWYIEDLHSTNGTYVDGARLLPGKPLPLRPDHYIRLGRLPVEIHGLEVAPWLAVTDWLSHT